MQQTTELAQQTAVIAQQTAVIAQQTSKIAQQTNLNTKKRGYGGLLNRRYKSSSSRGCFSPYRMERVKVKLQLQL
ncbi:hypothetical protein [Viridibacillus arvi]|uniref:hypothetical protein n=1 Tax=Viridibacillus arvi TaxID=263475 RepID=UPI0034CFDCD7